MLVIEEWTMNFAGLDWLALNWPHKEDRKVFLKSKKQKKIDKNHPFASWLYKFLLNSRKYRIFDTSRDFIGNWMWKKKLLTRRAGFVSTHLSCLQRDAIYVFKRKSEFPTSSRVENKVKINLYCRTSFFYYWT